MPTEPLSLNLIVFKFSCEASPQVANCRCNTWTLAVPGVSFLRRGCATLTSLTTFCAVSIKNTSIPNLKFGLTGPISVPPFAAVILSQSPVHLAVALPNIRCGACVPSMRGCIAEPPPIVW